MVFVVTVSAADYLVCQSCRLWVKFEKKKWARLTCKESKMFIWLAKKNVDMGLFNSLFFLFPNFFLVPSWYVADLQYLGLVFCCGLIQTHLFMHSRYAQMQKIALNKVSRVLTVQLLLEDRASPGFQCSAGNRAPVPNSFQTACVDKCFAGLPCLFSTACFQGKLGIWSSLPICVLLPLVYLFFNLLTFLHLWFFSSLPVFFLPTY